MARDAFQRGPGKILHGRRQRLGKFLAYARTVPHTLRNPLYHWTHIELKRFFGIQKLLNETTAKEIWDEANEKLASLPIHRILETNRVAVVCTTDDPTDSLEHHQKIRKSGTLATRVYPAFRPDKALAVDQPAAWNAWMNKLANAVTFPVSSRPCSSGSISSTRTAAGLSDHGLNYTYAEDCTESAAAKIFTTARAGTAT